MLSVYESVQLLSELYLNMNLIRQQFQKCFIVAKMTLLSFCQAQTTRRGESHYLCVRQSTSGQLHFSQQKIWGDIGMLVSSWVSLKLLTILISKSLLLHILWHDQTWYVHGDFLNVNKHVIVLQYIFVMSEVFHAVVIGAPPMCSSTVWYSWAGLGRISYM